MSKYTVGLDIAKRIFHAHVVDESERVIVSQKLRRDELPGFFDQLPPSLVGIEACGAAHHWSRELTAMGHEVKLMPASYVKPYVKRGKNDAVDAEAICEAVTRPTMRFVPVKSRDQQSVLMVQRTRALLIRQRTMLVNALRGHLSEMGIVAAVGIERIGELVDRALGREAGENPIPELVRSVVGVYRDQIQAINAKVKELEKMLRQWHRTSEASRRLAAIPGIGVIAATAMAATVTDPSAFGSGRAFAAWLGLTPRSRSSGGKVRSGRITKKGDRTIRTLLVLGATSIVRHARANKEAPLYSWTRKLLATKSARLTSVAIANKLARIAWAVMAKKTPFRPQLAAAAA